MKGGGGGGGGDDGVISSHPIGQASAFAMRQGPNMSGQACDELVLLIGGYVTQHTVCTVSMRQKPHSSYRDTQMCPGLPESYL